MIPANSPALPGHHAALCQPDIADRSPAGAQPQSSFASPQRDATSRKVQDLNIFKEPAYQKLFQDLETLGRVNIQGGEKLAVVNGTFLIQKNHIGQTLLRMFWNAVGYGYNRNEISNHLNRIHALAIKGFDEMLMDPQSAQYGAETTHFATLLINATQKVEHVQSYYAGRTPVTDQSILKINGISENFKTINNTIANDLLNPKGAVTKEHIDAFSKIAQYVDTVELKATIAAPTPNVSTMTPDDLKEIIKIAAAHKNCKKFIIPREAEHVEGIMLFFRKERCRLAIRFYDTGAWGLLFTRK